ncbi:probable tRNA (guanine(26)-N(2))-dimethyltransferase 1 isoform X1 [Zingiber officinale]|uniref:probable tRNA (guanine(26)-N(2))-dimethyltransferase 1 isoform X1 n=2 Tax=Zingiber officinale TaxID=94328 RepID=UPI001C4D218D|nr:probable tRNA (guanine(26)-N(2))-dimethyltransferase 1 isoform X1 [Zingiber officinale]
MRSLIRGFARMSRILPNLHFSFSSSPYSVLGIDIDDVVGEKLGNCTVIKEGEVKILLDSSNSVFYNKAQVHNRDMSIAVLRAFISKRKEQHAAVWSKKMWSPSDIIQERSSGSLSDGVCQMKHENGTKNIVELTQETTSKVQELKAPRVLEALAASGLRSLRYACEIEDIAKVVAVDYDPKCIEACKRNIQLNGSQASLKVETHLADARVYMLNHPKEFDVIDIDPYGSPSAFLDSAIQSIADGGLLMCSATDMPVLCGGCTAACYSRYGSYPTRAKYCHEMALRILLASIESHANRYKRYIVPVLSVQMDFYIRVFVRVFTSASAMCTTPLKLSYIYQCCGCDSFHLQRLGREIMKNNRVNYAPNSGPVVPQECTDCGGTFTMGGPMWSAPIHDQEWVTSMLENVRSMKEKYPSQRKILSVLTAVLEELPDAPLFVNLHSLCATLKCTSPSILMMRSALINAGYRFSGSHVDPVALKTDAPMHVIWDILRCWVKTHQVETLSRSKSSSGILSKEPMLQANFATPTGKSPTKKEPRFVPNPEKHWGPKVKAGRQIKSKHKNSPCSKNPERFSVSSLVPHQTLCQTLLKRRVTRKKGREVRKTEDLFS